VPNSDLIIQIGFMLAVLMLSVGLASCYQKSIEALELDNGFKRFCGRLIVILPCVCLIGLRGFDVGYDTQNMTMLLFSSHTDVGYLLQTQHDPLSIIVSWLLYYVLNGNAVLYLFTVSFFTNYLAFFAVEKWKSEICISKGWFVYCTYFALLGMDQFKQVFCLSLVLISLYYLCHGKKGIYLLLVLIACGFHFTAIVAFAFLPLSILEKAKYGAKTLVVLLFVFLSANAYILFQIAGSLFSDGAYGTYFSGYKFETEWAMGGGTGLLALVHLIPCFLPLLSYSAIPRNYRWTLCSMLLLAAPLRMLGYESQFLMRLYYEPALSIVITYPLVAAGLEGKKQFIFELLSVVVLIGYYFVVFSTSHGCIPYSLSIF